MLWVFDVQPKPYTTDVAWSRSTFDPFLSVNNIKLELNPNAKEFTPKEKVRSLNPYADPFKPLLIHPFKLNPLAKKFRPASVLNPTVVLFHPAAHKDDFQQKSSKLSPHAAEFVPVFGSNPLANDSQSEQENYKIFVTPVVTAVSPEVKDQTAYVNATEIVNLSEMEGEATGRSIVGQEKIEYFLQKEEKRLNKLHRKITNKYNFFRKQKLQKKLTEHEAVYELLCSFLNSN